MSSHLHFEESPHLPPRDHPYDLGMPLGTKTTLPYLPHNHFDGFMGAPFVPSSGFSLPPQLPFNDLSHHPGNFFRDTFIPNTQITLLDARPHIQEPSPHRVDSPQFIYPPSQPWNEVEPHHRGPLDNRDPPPPNYYQNIPPMQQAPAAPFTQSSWPVAEAQPSTHTQPAPSWTMSGSLDPATGVFQRAPEHPRVRTAQACEKCRIRKAKCSGEHPACQRCRNRGLDCQYAPERKMRGPNKIKKKGTSPVEAASGRRTSILSSGSSSDEPSQNGKSTSPAPASPFTTTPRRDTPSSDKEDSTPTGNGPTKPMVQTNFTFQLPPPTRVCGYSSDNPPRLRKVRPPPLDLSRTNLLNAVDATISGQSIVDPISPHELADPQSLNNTGRRASLPSYVLESYSRIPLDSHSSSGHNSGATTPQSMDSSDATELQYPHSSYPIENSPLSVYSAPHSNGSSASMSTPITPITLTSSFQNELDTSGYPLLYQPVDLPTLTAPYVPSLRESSSTDLGTMDNHFGPLDHMPIEPEGWGSLDDETPTASGKEKNLAQLESDMVVHTSN